jgi:predicted transcriptional regulator
MARPRGDRKAARLSVSLDRRIHAQLCALARKNDVSAAWLIRRAVMDLIARDAQPGDTLELPLSRRPSPARPSP